MVPDYDALKVYVSDRTDVGKGSVTLVVARRNGNGTVCYATFLIDLWKLGLKESSGNLSIGRDKFDKVYNKMIGGMMEREAYFHPIEIGEAKWLLAQGLRIARAVGTPYPSHWLKVVGNLTGVQITGSLYKCYRCERGELTESVDDSLVSLAREEGRAGIAGTPEESMVYFVCDRCSKLERPKFGSE
jgi:hypothetical protein